MTIPELIYAIGEKHKNDKFVLHPPVPEEMVKKFEKYLGFPLRGLYDLLRHVDPEVYGRGGIQDRKFWNYRYSPY